MSCMEAGSTPATFRRDVRLRRLGSSETRSRRSSCRTTDW
jgi:hypothetical protein